MLYSPGEDFERDNAVLGDCVSFQLNNLLMATQQPGSEVHNKASLVDSCLVGWQGKGSRSGLRVCKAWCG